jgi:uncharacterized membrane protein YczE
MTGLAFRTGRSIRAVRTVIEITVVAAGWALGGPVGLGTALYAISIGPLSQFFLTRLSIDRRWQHSKRQTMENRPPVECRP